MATAPTLKTSVVETPYAAILHALPSALLQLDGSGCIVYANPVANEWFGGKLLGRFWRELCAEDFSTTLDEGYLRHHSNRILSISTSALPKPPGQLVLLSDVSEIHILQKRVDREARLMAMGEMMARLAHQVRTPISAALLNLSVLRRRLSNDGKSAQVVRRVEERMLALEHMVRDMLMFTHGNSPNDHWMSVNTLVEEILANFEAMAEARKIDLKVERKAHGEVLINKVSFVSAINNLLDNASHYCAENAPLIKLSFHATAGQLLVVVEDNGSGIDPAQRNRIFDPFYSTRSDGTGLGLPVVQSVLRNHDGVLQLSHSELGGARFIAVLPAQRFKQEETL